MKHPRRRFAPPAAILVLALGLFGCTGASYRVEPLAAPLAPAPPPEYAIGDEFVYAVGPLEDVQRVVAVDAKNVTFESSTIFGTITQPKAFSNPVNFTGGSFASLYNVTLTEDLAGLFPLDVGKSVFGSGLGRLATGDSRVTHWCSVRSQERISVRAGSFDTFVVECLMQTDRGIGYPMMYWYAPELGHFAGFSRGRSFHELVRYSKASR